MSILASYLYFSTPLFTYKWMHPSPERSGEEEEERDGKASRYFCENERYLEIINVFLSILALPPRIMWSLLVYMDSSVR